MSSAIITVMSNAAVKASRNMLRDFGEVDSLQISRKGIANFVTKTDLKAEKTLVAELKKARPDYGFLLEEGGEIKGADSTHRWIIDPLDGTSNFIHAIPYFCISIALEREVRPGSKEIIAGIIYDPIHNEIFSAEKGKGALINGNRRMAVSRRETLDEAMLTTTHPRHAKDGTKALEMMRRVAASDAGLRFNGAAALDLAYVAAGRYDACWFCAAQPWDLAAGLLLVREAGGVAVGLFDGKPADAYSNALLASSNAMHPHITKLLAV